MGEALPNGTLVVTETVAAEDVKNGDVIVPTGRQPCGKADESGDCKSPFHRCWGNLTTKLSCGQTALRVARQLQRLVIRDLVNRFLTRLGLISLI